jgi:hypothetical protein
VRISLDGPNRPRPSLARDLVSSIQSSSHYGFKTSLLLWVTKLEGGADLGGVSCLLFPIYHHNQTRFVFLDIFFCENVFLDIICKEVWFCSTDFTQSDVAIHRTYQNLILAKDFLHSCSLINNHNTWLDS